MKKFPLIALSFIVLFSIFSIALAEDKNIRLKNRVFLPERTNDIIAGLNSFSGRHVIIQLDFTPNHPQRMALEKKGIKLLKSISGNVWLASVEKRNFADSKSPFPVRWIGQLLPSDKITKQIQQGALLPHAKYKGGRHVLDIGMHKDVTRERGDEILASVDGSVLDYAVSSNSYMVAMKTAMIETLSKIDEVMFIGEAGVSLTPTLNLAKPAVGGDLANAAPYSVTGKGITAMVLDGGTIATGANAHKDLAGRVAVAGFPMPDVIGHPTHVGCIVGGDGAASNGKYQGMAPQVDILTTSIIPELTMPPMYNAPSNIETAYKTAIQTHGVTVANNSIGSNIAQFGTIYCDKEGDYERSAQVIDSIANGLYGNITIVWANGNERENNDGACGNAYFTTAPPATAKNTITVGAVNKEDLSMTEFSSWGPVDDGRLRPDVSAPGCALNGTSIMSCAAGITGMGKSYVGFCGTSMACPVVTGGVALLQEYWAKHKSGNDPWGSTMKALVIHGAQDVGADGPDYKFGYGTLNIPDTLDLVDNAVIVEESLDQGETYSVTLKVTGDSVKVTLVYSDAPGELLAEKVLVNDLNLTLVSDSGTEHPWILDPENPANDAVKGTNSLDPAEQVEFNPDTGVETIEVFVTAAEVPEGPQNFSLIITGLTDESGNDDDDSLDDDDSGDDDDDSGAVDDDDDDDGCGC